MRKGKLVIVDYAACGELHAVTRVSLPRILVFVLVLCWCCVVLRCFGWAGLGWVGLDWVGLGWVGLGRFFSVSRVE